MEFSNVVQECVTAIVPITDVITVETVVQVLTIGGGIAVTFAFMWWGVRKLVQVLMSAFKKGKVSL